MRVHTKDEPALRPPEEAKDRQLAKKIERALEIRESSAKARKGKPVSFPTRRARS